MILRRIALPAGGLWLSAMPGRCEPLADFLRATAEARIGHVLCLTSREEIAGKSPDYAALLQAGGLPWQWHSHPIEDFGVPQDAEAFAAWIGEMAALLRAGEHLVLHCGAGIGRTGMTAIRLLRVLGIEDAARRIERAGSHPETAKQLAFSAAGCASARAGSARP